MADQQIPLVNSTEVYPEKTTPLIYVDGITNIAPGPQVVKMNFSIFDQAMTGSGAIRVATAMQLVMPLDSFIQTAKFMENIIEGLVRQQLLSPEKVEAIQATAGGGIGS